MTMQTSMVQKGLQIQKVIQTIKKQNLEPPKDPEKNKLKEK